jgi:hypothetical protein
MIYHHLTLSTTRMTLTKAAAIVVRIGSTTTLQAVAQDPAPSVCVLGRVDDNLYGVIIRKHSC